MADCICLPKCPFFHDKMQNMPSMSALLKKQYCQGDSSGCARHMVFEAKGKEAVPSTLYPSDVKSAQSILASG